jgi:hypothetical protein
VPVFDNPSGIRIDQLLMFGTVVCERVDERADFRRQMVAQIAPPGVTLTLP